MVTRPTGSADAQPTATPLLKWAGGKRQLLPHIRRFYPATFGTYIEPFFGSGAVFFDLWSAGRLARHPTVLIDSNSDLVGCYRMVCEHEEEVAAELERLAAAHKRLGTQLYYEVRDKRFNPGREARRLADGSISYTPELAAMLIYLNRTGFNGLFRVNASGRFNVPAGRYSRPGIAGRDRLRGVAAALGNRQVTLRCGSFTDVLGIAEAGDFLYVDPPYAPLSATASFTSYTASRFAAADQKRLQQVMIELAQRGCHVLLSNSTADAIAALYEGNREVRRAGLRAYRVPARRAVNSDPSRRGVVDEYLISNVERQP